jgi:serpin B
MTYAGARGNTEKQMMSVLHFDKNNKAFHEGFGALQARINEIQKKGAVKLGIANSLWIQKDFKFLPEFLHLTSSNYDAGLNYVDYAGETEKARVEINSWVEGKTNDKIKDLIGPGLLTQQARLVLANAIYFKGSWAIKFDTAQTKEMPFWKSKSDSVKVMTMTLRGHEFKYAEDTLSQYLELPYAGKDLSMIIVLPKTRAGLQASEVGLTQKAIAAIIALLRDQKVDAFIPKFKTTESFLLNKPLESAGMTDAFGSGADFTGMTGNKALYISAVIHKAFVDVNEEGTEAAAATAVVMVKQSAHVYHPPTVFRADHPFLFLIRDNTTGSILFWGRIVDPKTE